MTGAATRRRWFVAIGSNPRRCRAGALPRALGLAPCSTLPCADDALGRCASSPPSPTPTRSPTARVGSVHHLPTCARSPPAAPSATLAKAPASTRRRRRSTRSRSRSPRRRCQPRTTPSQRRRSRCRWPTRGLRVLATRADRCERVISVRRQLRSPRATVAVRTRRRRRDHTDRVR